MIGKIVKSKNEKIYLILDKIIKGSYDYYLVIDIDSHQIGKIEPEHIVEIGRIKDKKFENITVEMINDKNI